jgi:hypothetical protein
MWSSQKDKAAADRDCRRLRLSTETPNHQLLGGCSVCCMTPPLHEFALSIGALCEDLIGVPRRIPHGGEHLDEHFVGDPKSDERCRAITNAARSSGESIPAHRAHRASKTSRASPGYWKDHIVPLCLWQTRQKMAPSASPTPKVWLGPRETIIKAKLQSTLVFPALVPKS